MVVILACALATRTVPVFVKGYFFGFDFLDFFRAANDWAHGINPYLRPRFFTPPPSLLVGVAFQRIGFSVGRYAFAALNVTLVAASVVAVGRWLRLSLAAQFLLVGIALLYAPTFFLVDRGNLDGLMLACVAWAVTTRRAWLRGALIGFSAGLKLYSALLVVPMLRARRWKTLAVAGVAAVVLLLPFWALLVPFGHALVGRGTVLFGTENISPAAILGSFGRTLPGKMIFAGFWLGTLVVAMMRERETLVERRMLAYLPWMAAFPLQVYPYTGVLLLPVLAWRMFEIRGWRWNVGDKVFVLGFLLVGVHQQALTQYFQWLVQSHRFFPMMNSIGMILVLVAMSLARDRAGDAEIET